MPTTRRQAALSGGEETVALEEPKPRATTKKGAGTTTTQKKQTQRKKGGARAGTKRKKAEVEEEEAEEVPAVDEGAEEKEPPPKRAKTEEREVAEKVEGKAVREATPAVAYKEGKEPVEKVYQEGTLERGHIYFFYRPRVQVEEVQSVEDVQRFNIVLVPRPPKFAVETTEPGGTKGEKGGEEEMKLLEPGADVIPAPEPKGQEKKPFRLLTVGKKSLPDPEAGGGRGAGRKETFWALITTVGEDLNKLEQGLGERSYETSTRGPRYQAPARLAARGAYAFVNRPAPTPSRRETHLGYHLSHPREEEFGEVHQELGIHRASSFVVQVKNPLAPDSGMVRVGLPKYRKAEYPEEIMRKVFGVGGARGREEYGRRFTSVETKEMLDYEGVELLLIAARAGEQGLEESLGEGRGMALKEAEKEESREPIDEVMEELAFDAEKIPAEPLKGEWI